MKKIILIFLLMTGWPAKGFTQSPRNPVDSVINWAFQRKLKGPAFFSSDDVPPVQYHLVKFLTDAKAKPIRWIAPEHSSIGMYKTFEESITTAFAELEKSPKRYTLERNMTYVVPIKITRMNDTEKGTTYISPKKFRDLNQDIFGYAMIEPIQRLRGKLVLVELIEIPFYP